MSVKSSRRMPKREVRRSRVARGSWRISWRGNILPLALIITSSILLAGIGLGIVVLDSIRRSADTDASMLAYYAADGGIERQLYELRKHAYRVADLTPLSGVYGNTSNWTAATAGYLQTLQKSFPVVKKGDFQFVDLYDPDNLNLAGGIGRVDFSWGAGSDCPGGIPSDMELGYAEWLSGGAVLPNNFSIIVRSTPAGSNFNGLSPLKGYRLRFRPKSCTAANLRVEVSPTSVTYSPVPFPGDITIGSTGTYKRATQSVSVQVPRQDVLSGVFGYVLFSECQLFKDPTAPGPACP